MKKLLLALVLFTFSFAARAADPVVVADIAGCWYETKTPVSSKYLDAGSIRLAAYDDGYVVGIRSFDGQIFDELFGTYTVRFNRAGRVLSVTYHFSSDWAGEQFTIVFRGVNATGKFIGGGYKGVIRVRELPEKSLAVAKSKTANKK